ncbi:hypothetical protein [Tautonia sociabilis]|uniref:Uncharacterized protein n=1 Tax=Tautonia sociabilis TaxID=2080755 RepID=A0A432ME44_9BACT|nr:hypothetical protein [Tautonia sociabilis]RUL83424.1 hypothetical protein TsocGM_22200 [Tautonia sociabilis]
MHKGHGRVEVRSLEVTTWPAEYLASDWPGCAQVFRLERARRSGGEVKQEVVFGITSLPRERAGAAELSRLIRGHWRIENPQSDDPRSDNLCVAGRAGYHLCGGPACAGLMA